MAEGSLLEDTEGEIRRVMTPLIGWPRIDAWLAKVRAEAWDQGWVSAMQYEGRCQDAEAAGQGVFITKPKNPYRTTEGEKR